VAVDVVTEIEIAVPRAQVAAYAADPSNAPEWYVNIASVEWETTPPVVVGSRIAFVAQFLGRRIAYTYEVSELVPGERLVTTYTWADSGSGTTMTLRNAGDPHGFGAIAAPVMASAMRRANRKDLVRLKTILESR
jgi:uncharacterized protein YndB with AHSA1/START domain